MGKHNFPFSESADRENEEIEEEPEDFKDCPTDQVRAYTLQATGAFFERFLASVDKR